MPNLQETKIGVCRSLSPEKYDVSSAIEKYFQENSVRFQKLKYSLTGEDYFVFEFSDDRIMPELFSRIKVDCGTISRVIQNFEDGVKYVSHQFARSIEYFERERQRVTKETQSSILSGDIPFFGKKPLVDKSGFALDRNAWGFLLNEKDSIYDMLYG